MYHEILTDLKEEEYLGLTLLLLWVLPKADRWHKCKDY